MSTKILLRITARVDAEIQAFLQRAAIQLSERDAQKLVEMLDAPVRTNHRLQQAAERYQGQSS